MAYPDIGDKNFYNKINKIYDKFKVPKKKKSFDDICFPKKYELQLPQQFLPEYINPKTPYKGVLVYHRIGAGKTCTAIRVGEMWKNHRKIIVVLPASLKGNFRSELRSPCAGENYLKESERKQLKQHHPSSTEYKEIIKRSDKRIDDVYTIYSYNKFVELANEKKISFKNSVLIIDEVQNMVSEEGLYYSTLHKMIYDAPKDLRIVLLSATPMFDKPSEIALTLNLLRMNQELPTGRDFYEEYIKILKHKDGEYSYDVRNMSKFKKIIKGYVSFYRGAPQYVFPELKIKYVKCEMSDFQYKAYKDVMKKEAVKYTNDRALGDFLAKKILTVEDLPNNFFIGTRMVSNIVFPNRQINEEGYKSLKGSRIVDQIEKYSSKFSRILTKINNSHGKIFIYSSFREYGGLRSLTFILEELGYKNYLQHGEGYKRYAVWSGEEKIQDKDEIRAVYNHIDNLNGSKLKIILGSPATKEGISFTAVQQVHILEPYWNQSRLEQIIGRASRYCSHKDVPEEKRKVKVYVYIAVHQNEKKTVDQHMYILSEQKNKLVGEFERAIKEAAVDCTINYNANVYENEEPITCVV